MTKDELFKIGAVQAYEWVKTGHWNLKQFTQWFHARMEQCEQKAWAQRE